MIDKNKMQIEILKDLLSPRSSCRLVNISDDEVAITDGFKVIILQADTLYIDISLIPEMSFDFSEARKDHPAVFETGITKKDDKGRTITKLQSADGEVVSYVQEQYTKLFSGCLLYTESGDDFVYAKDGMGNLVGLFLPMRVKDKF